MIFPYTPYEVEPTPSDPGALIVYRPIIPFRLIGTVRSAVFYGLLDTGSDETLLPRAMADLVGMKFVPAPTRWVMSASGELEVAYGEVSFEFGRGRGRYFWRTTVGIVDQAWEVVVLGHAGFLKYFDVQFLGGKREARLKRNTVPFSMDLCFGMP